MRTTKLVLMIALTGLMYFVPYSGNSIMAQQNGRGKGICQQQNKRIGNYTNIPNLTEDQKQKIENLQTTHQSEMDVLRNEKQSTRSVDEKNTIDAKMKTKIDAHKKAVRNLLTPEQQKYFDENCTNTRRTNRNKGMRNGRGTRRGSCR